MTAIENHKASLVSNPSELVRQELLRAMVVPPALVRTKEQSTVRECLAWATAAILLVAGLYAMLEIVAKL